MGIKLFDSELKVMDLLWRDGETSAKELAAKLSGSVGWNKNTTYTVIKKCVEKGAVERREPGFVCRALVSREEVREQEVDELIGKHFGGSVDLLFAALLNRKKLPPDAVDRLERLIADAQEGKL